MPEKSSLQSISKYMAGGAIVAAGIWGICLVITSVAVDKNSLLSHSDTVYFGFLQLATISRVAQSDSTAVTFSLEIGSLYLLLLGLVVGAVVGYIQRQRHR